jgi:hypothetical protein
MNYSQFDYYNSWIREHRDPLDDTITLFINLKHF